jgi:hypothetical protein
MHQITGYFFFSNKKGKKYVVYSTLYKSGRYASMHNCTGMSDDQARGAFILEHSREVDHLLTQEKANKNQSKIIV